jgi:plastocyanin
MGPERIEPGVETPRDEQRPDGFGWRRLQIVAAFGVVAALALPMVIERSLEPFLLAMAAPFVVGLVVARRRRKAGAIWLGVSSLALLLFSAPFLADALAHPESLADFVPLCILGASIAVGVIAATPSVRQAPGPDRPSLAARVVGIVAGALVLVGIVVSVVAFSRIESVSPVAGDTLLAAQDLRFDPVTVGADAGSIAVLLTNHDTTRHTFTIDELGVDLSVPPNTSQRVTFDAGAGTYRFYCRPHAPGMEGELVVG